jgi:hypothetical protein
MRCLLSIPRGAAPRRAGSRGHDSRLARFFLGSVSTYLVQNAAATVLVVRPPAQDEALAEPLLPVPPPAERTATPRKVAIALDPAADTARAQVRWAIQYVLRSGDEVKLLHGPTGSGEMRVKHDSNAYTGAAVVMQAAVDTIAPYVSKQVHPTTIMFTPGGDVRDEARAPAALRGTTHTRGRWAHATA